MNPQWERRDFLKQLALGGFVLTSPLLWGKKLKQKAPHGRRNIIFIMADDHASHAMSCYGSQLLQTPQIDRLAQNGVLFQNCFCTNSICAPSRAVILTGKYSHINGVKDNRTAFDGSQATLPKLLKQNGYQTAMLGKWHLKSEPTGFDYWCVLPGQGQYVDPQFNRMGEKIQTKGYVTDIITDFALDWLKGRDLEKPFFLMCHHKAPHRRWIPDAEHQDAFSGKTFPLPETFDDDYTTRSKAASSATMTIERHLLPKDLKKAPPEGMEGHDLKVWKYQRYMQDYLACVASIDDNMGRFLDYLEEEGLVENTMIVYTSDQGFYLGDHGWFDKRFMYEESLRMPLLIQAPGVSLPGSVCRDMVLNVDFAPTFLDFAGVSVPNDMQGGSFLPLLKGEKPTDWRTSVYYHYFEYPAVHSVKRHYGIRTQRYKLIHFYNDIDAWELFDLESDPHELHNLISDPDYVEIRKDLEKELAVLREQFRDSEG